VDAIDLLAEHLANREADEPGQQSRLARHLNVSPGLVWQWLNRKRPVAPAHCRGIEEYTRGREPEVTRYQLQPEVFGPPPGVFGEMLGELRDVLREEEVATLKVALQRGPEHLYREIEALEHSIDVRAQLLAAAQLSQGGAE
jgi:DNA-binding transcriptional regulator YdaS (Cro superfamily)